MHVDWCKWHLSFSCDCMQCQYQSRYPLGHGHGLTAAGRGVRPRYQLNYVASTGEGRQTPCRLHAWRSRRCGRGAPALSAGTHQLPSLPSLLLLLLLHSSPCQRVPASCGLHAVQCNGQGTGCLQQTTCSATTASGHRLPVRRRPMPSDLAADGPTPFPGLPRLPGRTSNPKTLKP